MPELGQQTMTEQLTRLIEQVLSGWEGALPRLHYVTDAGHHPQDFFRTVLARMRHPRSAQRLEWTWAVDFYHAAERISTLAEALFGSGRQASAWAEKQRRILKHKTGGSCRVVQSALALRRRHGLAGSEKKFDEALNYLRKYRRWMDYAQYVRLGLPIGSGVTEAACKTLIGYRFKQSGMRWLREQGQHVLNLRTIAKSGLWHTVRHHWLTTFTPCRPVTSRTPAVPTHEIPTNNALLT
jgi:hypothetical protein